MKTIVDRSILLIIVVMAAIRIGAYASDINKPKVTTTKVNVAQADGPQTGTSGPPPIPDQERKEYNQKLEQELEGAAGPFVYTQDREPSRHPVIKGELL